MNSQSTDPHSGLLTNEQTVREDTAKLPMPFSHAWLVLVEFFYFIQFNESNTKLGKHDWCIAVTVLFPDSSLKAYSHQEIAWAWARIASNGSQWFKWVSYTPSMSGSGRLSGMPLENGSRTHLIFPTSETQWCRSRYRLRYRSVWTSS